MPQVGRGPWSKWCFPLDQSLTLSRRVLAAKDSEKKDVGVAGSASVFLVAQIDNAILQQFIKCLVKEFVGKSENNWNDRRDVGGGGCGSSYGGLDERRAVGT